MHHQLYRCALLQSPTSLILQKPILQLQLLRSLSQSSPSTIISISSSLLSISTSLPVHTPHVALLRSVSSSCVAHLDRFRLFLAQMRNFDNSRQVYSIRNEKWGMMMMHCDCDRWWQHKHSVVRGQRMGDEDERGFGLFLDIFCLVQELRQINSENKNFVINKRIRSRRSGW